MGKFSELEEIGERVHLLTALDSEPFAIFLRFMMDTKQLSRVATIMLFLVAFEGYEIGGPPRDRKR